MPYYRFLDSMSDEFSTSIGSRQTPGFPITKNWINGSKFKDRIASIVASFVKYASEHYPLLSFEKMISNPRLRIDFAEYI
jgi:hypothetical protein